MSLLLKPGGILRLITNVGNKSVRRFQTLRTVTNKSPQVGFLTYKQNCDILRFKSKSSKKKEKDVVVDSDEEAEGEELEDFDSFLQDKSTKKATVRVNSMRVDLLLKNSLGISRGKVEEAFYQSKIRINGKKIFKKSDPVQVGDEVDLIKGVNDNNPKLLMVARVEILDAKPKSESYEVRLRRCKSLVVDNYEDAWEPGE